MDLERHAFQNTLAPFSDVPPPQPRNVREPRVPNFMSMESLYGNPVNPQPARPVYDAFRESPNSLAETRAPKPPKEFGGLQLPDGGLAAFVKRSND